MSTCRPPENSWLRQEPWKPLALGALASIPAYLGIRALKYGQLASLAAGALAFTAVTLTTGLRGAEVAPQREPGSPSPNWTEQVQASLQRLHLSDKILELVTDDANPETLAQILSPKIARAVGGRPWPHSYEIWVGGQCFLANTMRDYSRVLFTPDQLAHLTADMISQALEGLDQQPVEIEGKVLYLQPGVTLPPGTPTLVDTQWKSELKELFKPDLHPVIDRLTDKLDNRDTRKTLSAAIINAYWKESEPNTFNLHIDGTPYVVTNCLASLAQDFVFTAKQLQNFHEATALTFLMKKKGVSSLTVDGTRIFVTKKQMGALMGQFSPRFPSRKWTQNLTYDPASATLNLGTGFNFPAHLTLS